MTQAEPQAAGGPGQTMFQIVARKSDGLVLGTHPKGGVGPNNEVAVIHDMTQWDVLMKTDPAYLSSDGTKIVSTPRA